MPVGVSITRSSQHSFQDHCGLRVGPVADDFHEDVAVACRQKVGKKVARDERQPLRCEPGHLSRDVCLVEQDAVRFRGALKDGRDQVARPPPMSPITPKPEKS